MADAIERWLRELRAELRHDPLLARRVCEEARDHLAEIVAEERSRGMTPDEAEEAAVRRFGAPGPLARRFDRFSFPLRLLLACAGFATLGLASWLFIVITTVLPSRDPAHVPLWTGFALGFLAYAALSLAFVLRGPHPAALRAAVTVLSLAAVAFGAAAIAVTSSSAHFEGYLVLMGVVLAGHGLSALGYVALTAGIARQVRASR